MVGGYAYVSILSHDWKGASTFHVCGSGIGDIHVDLSFFVFCFMANRSISGLPNTCIWHIVLNITGFLSVPVCSIDLPIHSCVPECVLGPLSHCALRTSVVTSVSDCTFR